MARAGACAAAPGGWQSREAKSRTRSGRGCGVALAKCEAIFPAGGAEEAHEGPAAQPAARRAALA